MILNKKQLAEALDLDVQTIKLWQDWGCPIESLKRGRDGHQFDLGKVVAWRLTRSADGGETTREKLSRVNAELKELELAEARAKVVSRDDVVQVWAAAVSAMRNKLRAMRRKVTPLITTRERMVEVEAILGKHIDQALTELTSNEFAEGIISGLEEGAAGSDATARPDGKPVGRRKPKAE